MTETEQIFSDEDVFLKCVDVQAFLENIFFNFPKLLHYPVSIFWRGFLKKRRRVALMHVNHGCSSLNAAWLHCWGGGYQATVCALNGESTNPRIN